MLDHVEEDFVFFASATIKRNAFYIDSRDSGDLITNPAPLLAWFCEAMGNQVGHGGWCHHNQCSCHRAGEYSSGAETSSPLSLRPWSDPANALSPLAVRSVVSGVHGASQVQAECERRARGGTGAGRLLLLSGRSVDRAQDRIPNPLPAPTPSTLSPPPSLRCYTTSSTGSVVDRS